MIFPAKVLEQHIAVVGKTGSGKTVTAKGIVEHLMDQGERVCIIDPVSAWWGLRSSAAGKGDGYPVVIFGGKRADIPIGGSHGAAVADTVASSKTSTIIDLKLLSVKDRTQFFTDFAVRIMQSNETVLHMVIDEAHLFAPKGRVNSNKAGEMLSETNNLVTGGRGLGLRFVLITQRPAKLHNDCLGSCETLVAMRVTLPADRDAVESWVKGCATLEEGAEVLSSLPRLPTGEGWIWSPEANILKRTQFPMIKTFDSSNPKNLYRANVKLSAINIPELRAKLEEAAGDIINDDPVQLKRLLQKAQQELRARPSTPSPAPAAKPVDPFTLPQVKAAIAQAGKDARATAVLEFSDAIAAIDRIAGEVKTAQSVSASIRKEAARTQPPALERKPAARVESDVPVKKAPQRETGLTVRVFKPGPGSSAVTTMSVSTGSAPGGAVRRMMVAMAQRPGLNKKQLGVRASIASSGGSFRTHLSTMRKEHWLDETDGFRLNELGLQTLGGFDTLPEGGDLLEHWAAELGGGSAKILRALSHSITMTKEDLGNATDIQHTGGSFRTYLSKLKTLELISVNNGAVTLSEELY